MKGVWVLGPVFILPFILFGFGIIPVTHLIAASVFILYLSLLIINFEAGFLSLIFIRSSIDFLKNFTHGSNLNLAGAVSLVLIVLGVFYVLYRKIDVFKYKDTGPFLLFLGVCGLSIVYSPDAKESISDWLRLVSTFSVYILTRIIFNTSEKIRQIFMVILFSALLPITVAFYQLVTGHGTVLDSGQNRIVGTFLHPNAFATYILILLIFSTAQILEKSEFISRRLMIGLMLPASVIFVFTYSRGAWFVFIPAMVLMGVLRYRKILGFLPIILVVAVLFIPAVKDRIINISDAGYTHGRSGWDWRVDTWKEVSQMVAKKPILGHGLGSVEFEFGILPHNDYLRLLCEVGVVGLLAYLFLAAQVLFQTWKDFLKAHTNISKSFQLGLLAVLVAFLIRELADNTLRNTVTVIYFWIFVAISRNIAEIDQKEFESAVKK